MQSKYLDVIHTNLKQVIKNIDFTKILIYYKTLREMEVFIVKSNTFKLLKGFKMGFSLEWNFVIYLKFRLSFIWFRGEFEDI